MSKNKLIAKNTIFMAIRTLISLFVSFYTTRVILSTLGVSDYGLFNVIYGVVAFFVFIVSSFNDSIQRFLSISMGRGKTQEVKNIIKNSLLIYFIGGSIFCLFLIVCKSYVVLHLLNLPTSSLNTAKLLYTISIASIFITIMQTPLNALVLSHEKMSFYAYMAIFDAISKLLMVYLLVYINGDKVIIYSLLLLGITSLVFCIYATYCYSKFKYTFFGGKYSLQTVKEISSFSMWNVFGNFAYVCRTQGNNILINIFFGVAVNAAYAISVSVINASNSLVQSFISAIRPQVFKSFGENDLKRFYLLVSMGSKYTFCFLFIICCPILIATDFVLKKWLLDVPHYSVLFVRGFLIIALIDSFSNCIITGIQATGKIRAYQLAVSFLIFLNLPITYILFKFGLEPKSIFYSLLIMSTICLPTRLYFIKKTADFDVLDYTKKVILPCLLLSALSGGINYLISLFFDLSNAYELVSYFIVNGIVSLALIYLIVMSHQEKSVIHKIIIRRTA